MKLATKDEKDPVTTLYLRGVPVSLKRRFKSYTARRGINMNSKIIEIITELLDKKSNGKK